MGALLGADVAMGALLGDDVSGGDDDAMMHVTDATALQMPRWFPGPVLGGQSLLVPQMLPRCASSVFESHCLGQSVDVSHDDEASFEHVPVVVLVVSVGDVLSVGDVFVVGSGAGAWRVFLPLPSIISQDPARRRAKRSCFGFMICQFLALSVDE